IYVARKTEEFSLLITERSRINQDLTHDVDVKKLRDLRDVFFSISSLYQVDMTTCDHNTDVLQLFFDTGKGFNEKESLKVQHDLINEEKKYSLPINSNNQEVTSIRIDPSNFSGVYQVRDVRFYDTSNQKIELFKISGNYKCNIGKSYVFLEDDPHIIFDLDSSAHVKLVEFELITGSHSLQELIIENNKITSTKNDRILDLEEQLESIKDLLEERKNDLQLLQKTISEITLTVGYKDDQMDVLRKENSILSDRINEKELQLKNSLEEINSIYQTKGWRAIQFFKKIIGKQ
ncbi:hypothetical protein, partial [Paenibacillus sp. Marseille-Q4541]|uniref:hypothetical protein n=1 Tax=Paenibacillus sp. Marseille-Q4541 TaxID=2831522 RepID=UPI001BA5E27D